MIVALVRLLVHLSLSGPPPGKCVTSVPPERQSLTSSPFKLVPVPRPARALPAP